MSEIKLFFVSFSFRNNSIKILMLVDLGGTIAKRELERKEREKEALAEYNGMLQNSTGVGGRGERGGAASQDSERGGLYKRGVFTFFFCSKKRTEKEKDGGALVGRIA